MFSYSEFLSFLRTAGQPDPDPGKDAMLALFDLEPADTQRRLGLAWDYAQARDCKTIRRMTGRSRADFCRFYGLPPRTVQDWERGVSNPPEYVLDLLAYSVISSLNYEGCDCL